MVVKSEFLIPTLVCGALIAAQGDCLHAFQETKAKTGNETIPTHAATEKHRSEFPARVQRLVFSTDGQHVAGEDLRTIVIWDVSTGKEKRRIPYMNGQIARLAFSPDGTHLMAGVLGKTIDMWEIASGRNVFSVPFPIGIAAFASGGKEIVGVPFSGEIQIRDAKDGALIREIPGRTATDRGYSLSPDSTILALGQPDKTIKLRSLDSGKDIFVFKAAAAGVGFSPSGKLLICQDRSENTEVIYDRKTGNIVQKFKFAKTPTRVAMSHDDKWFAAAIWSKDGSKISIREVATGNEVLTLQQGQDQPLALAFSPKGNLLAASSGELVQIWELSSSKVPPEKPKVDPPPVPKLSIKEKFRAKRTSDDGGKEMAFSADGQLLAVREKKGIIVHDIPVGKEIIFVLADDVYGKLGFTAEGNVLAHRKLAGELKEWDHSGKEISSIPLRFEANFLGLLPEGKGFVCGSRTRIVVCDAKGAIKKDRLNLIVLEEGATWDATVLSPNGYRVAQLVGARRVINVWRVETSSKVVLKHEESVVSMSFDASGKRLASASIDAVRIWDAQTGQMLNKIALNASAVAFSADGKWLAVGLPSRMAGDEERIYLFDAATGQVLHSWKSECGPQALAFSPRGHLLASIGHRLVQVVEISAR